jgi:hypothetical protein
MGLPEGYTDDDPPDADIDLAFVPRGSADIVDPKTSSGSSMSIEIQPRELPTVWK